MSNFSIFDFPLIGNYPATLVSNDTVDSGIAYGPTDLEPSGARIPGVLGPPHYCLEDESDSQELANTHSQNNAKPEESPLFPLENVDDIVSQYLDTSNSTNQDLKGVSEDEEIRKKAVKKPNITPSNSEENKIQKSSIQTTTQSKNDDAQIKHPKSHRNTTQNPDKESKISTEEIITKESSRLGRKSESPRDIQQKQSDSTEANESSPEKYGEGAYHREKDQSPRGRRPRKYYETRPSESTYNLRSGERNRPSYSDEYQPYEQDQDIHTRRARKYSNERDYLDEYYDMLMHNHPEFIPVRPRRNYIPTPVYPQESQLESYEHLMHGRDPEDAWRYGYHSGEAHHRGIKRYDDIMGFEPMEYRARRYVDRSRSRSKEKYRS